jgi:hypothetical protein
MAGNASHVKLRVEMEMRSSIVALGGGASGATSMYIWNTLIIRYERLTFYWEYNQFYTGKNNFFNLMFFLTSFNFN